MPPTDHLPSTDQNNAGPHPSSSYHSWIDWMKFFGMAIILGGHTGLDALIGPGFNPINPKQLGVAFFVLITGFSLAPYSHIPSKTVIRRYSPVFVYGLFLAIVYSLVGYLVQSDIAESNYLPFVGGINAFWENAFPANPSTWYVGTYLHILIVWAFLLRHVQPSWNAVLILTILEIGIRTLWMSFGRDFNAYMCFTSWLPMLMAGLVLGRTIPSQATFISGESSRTSWVSNHWPCLAGVVMLIVFFLFWSQLVDQHIFTKKNPYGRIPAANPLASNLATSIAVSIEYAAYTFCTFLAVHKLPCPQAIRFLSRHTLWVFLAHMPIRDILTPLYYPWIEAGWVRQGVNFLVLFVGLAWMSEGLARWFHLPKICKWLESWALSLLNGRAATPH